MGSYDTQYQPLAADEVDIDAAVSVRQPRDLAAGVNNAIITCAPRIPAMGWPSAKPTSAASTAETVILRNVGPIWLGAAYNRLVWSISAKNTDTGTVTWTLYTHWKPYTDSNSITPALATQMGHRDTSTIAVTSITGAVQTEPDHVIIPSLGGTVYLTLTATSSSALISCSLDSFSATPWIQE